jgi:predicted RND superfamily exporter protein
LEKFFKFPALVVGVITVITVFFALQLPRAELDNDMTKALPENNEAYLTSKYLDDTFGQEQIIFIGLERPYGSVFDRDFLARIRRFSDEVETIDFVKEVTSLLTMPYITADGESIVISDLVDDDFSGTPAEIAELKRRLSSWDLYERTTVSENLAATQIIVSLDIATMDAMKPEVQSAVKAVREKARETFSALANIYVTGDPIVTQTANEAMSADLGLLIPIVIVVILGVLFFSFRRFTYVVLPLLTVIITVIWTLGAMPLFGVKLTIISTILPIILIAVGSAYGIHVVSHYIDDIKNKTLSRAEHREMVFQVLRKVFKPTLLAALTTAAGFVSFIFTLLKPMREFGVFSSIGVAAALIIAVTLIPSLLIIRGPARSKPKKEKNAVQPRRVSKTGTALADVLTAICGQRAAVITAALFVIAVSVYGLGKLVIDNSMVEFFRADTDVYQSDNFIRKYFGGTMQFTFAVEADTTEELLDPRVLTAVDNLGVYLTERVPYVAKVSGFTDMVKRMNQMFNVDESPDGIRAKSSTGEMAEDDFSFGDFGFEDFGPADNDRGVGAAENATVVLSGESDNEAIRDLPPPASSETTLTFAMLENAIGKNTNMSANTLVRELQRAANYEGRAYYEIPADPARYGKQTEAELEQLIANYLVLVGDDSDGGYANDPFEPTAVRSVIQVNSKWWADTKTVIEAVNAYASANFPANVRVISGGSAVVLGEVTDSLMQSQIISILISVLIVIVILAVSNRSIAAGLLGAVPISMAILCNFGVMGLLGITLNMGTALVASLAVGIGIDYTIHFMEFFKMEYQASGGVANAPDDAFLRRTFSGCGKAILINAVSVGAGFGVLALSRFRVISNLGGLIALSMLITAIISLTLMPVLFTIFRPGFIYGKVKHS